MLEGLGLKLGRSVHPTYVFKKRGGGQILCSSHYYHTPHLHYILNFFQFWSEDFGSNTTYISETSASKYLLRKELRPFNKYHLQCAQYVVCLRLRSATQSILRLAHARLCGSRQTELRWRQGGAFSHRSGYQAGQARRPHHARSVLFCSVQFHFSSEVFRNGGGISLLSLSFLF